MDGSWQTVPTKRTRPNSPSSEIDNDNDNAKKRNVNDTNNNSNRFQLLATNNDSDAAEAAPSTVGNDAAVNNVDDDVPKPPVPPPIIFPSVSNINSMVEAIRDTIGSEFYYKLTKKEEIRLSVVNVDNYRKLIKSLEESKILYHTYQLKEERSFRVVLKGLHHTTDVTDIKAHLLTLQHDVRYISNATNRLTKLPINMFFVDLKPQANNREIYNIKYLTNAVVTIEPINKSGNMVQCFRCPEFGHTLNARNTTLLQNVISPKNLLQRVFTVIAHIQLATKVVQFINN